ncbi:MAG TPA: hypothetical protein VN513_15755, partial [Gemmatimonadales bacterium]|nr:hypothetical protein [Gemmatimonadales bacterium]
MSVRRVIAFGMHEPEIAEAAQAIRGGEVTQSFVVGEADDAAIAALRARGLIVQDVQPAAGAPLAPSGRLRTFSAGAKRRAGKRPRAAKPTH